MTPAQDQLGKSSDFGLAVGVLHAHSNPRGRKSSYKPQLNLNPVVMPEIAMNASLGYGSFEYQYIPRTSCQICKKNPVWTRCRLGSRRSGVRVPPSLSVPLAYGLFLVSSSRQVPHNTANTTVWARSRGSWKTGTVPAKPNTALNAALGSTIF